MRLIFSISLSALGMELTWPAMPPDGWKNDEESSLLSGPRGVARMNSRLLTRYLCIGLYQEMWQTPHAGARKSMDEEYVV